MERLIESLVDYAGVVVPLLTLWAIVGLCTVQAGCRCVVTELLYYFVMIIVSVITLRTVLADDGCWLIHTVSLGVLIVAGVMQRPQSTEVPDWTLAD